MRGVMRQKSIWPMSGDVIIVSLEELLRDGVFGPVEFGMAGDEILSALGAPDTVFTRRRSRQPTGFEYGDVEFYFIDAIDHRLCTINLNHFEVPKGNASLGLDPWWLRGGLPRPEAEARLALAGIPFAPTVMPDPTMDGIVTASGVTLGFIR